MEVHLATTASELEKVGTVLLQLRPQYDMESLVAQIQRQQAEGYQLAYVEDAGRVLCVAGFVVAQKLAWGRHIYIDDLVTDASYRSTGAGKYLLNWFKDYAREIGCGQIHLDSGVQRFAAHRFYQREGFAIASHHFSLTELN
ncbi:GNAT family N-acetyltransferase [Microbulbifer sp. SAOS-129_SWC]|uniref:GNAT family N-acetyltransferase n=1 Tax=Microbulbifer sp. SAOS-129_SWC TaxID=3145235 RepID=UPI0032172815